jgi:hypothetical protein
MYAQVTVSGSLSVSANLTATADQNIGCFYSIDGIREIHGVSTNCTNPRFSNIAAVISDWGASTVGEITEPLPSTADTALPSCATSSTAISGNAACSGGGATFSGQRREIWTHTPTTGDESSGEMGPILFLDNWSATQGNPDNNLFIQAYYHPALILKNLNSGVGHRTSVVWRKPGSVTNCGGPGSGICNMWYWQADINNDGTDKMSLVLGVGAGGIGRGNGGYSVLQFTPQTNANVGSGTTEQGFLESNMSSYGLLRANSVNNDNAGNNASFSLRNSASTRETFIGMVGSNANGTVDVALNTARGCASNCLFRIHMDGTGSIETNSADSASPIPVNLTNGINLAGNPIVQDCGITSSCAHTARAKFFIVAGSAPLISGTPSTVTISGFSPTFTSASSYYCTVSNETTPANSLKWVPVSSSSITITGPNTVTDTVSYICIGN